MVKLTRGQARRSLSSSIACMLLATMAVALPGDAISGPCTYDVDHNGAVQVSTDVVYLARHLLGLIPVPPSFRAQNPNIAPDAEI